MNPLRSLLFALVLAGSAFGQAPATPAPAKPVAEQAKPAEQPKPGELKKYADVISKEAQTQQGMFKVHRIQDKVYWEIPAKLIGRLFLWQTEIAELPSELGYPGTAAGTKAIRFTRRNNKLYMRSVSFGTRSASDGAVAAGVEANSIEPIIGEFDILTEGEGKAPVIEVTNLFTTDPADFSVKAALGASGVDSSRSYVDRVKAFPENVETRSQLTFTLGGGGGFFFRRIDSSTATVVVHYSLDLLPEKPMMGRLKDTRIGYFTTDFTEYGRDENRSVDRRFIDRFRMEKKDPGAAVSDPVKPITFYLSREVPEKWRPYLKAGIEDWRPAFELAGFKDAIIAKDAPSTREDPTWDPEDARYSVIRWAPSTTENAMGPSIQDPRSGETLSAHVIVWNDVVRLAENWYFSQCAAIDPRARHLPMPDALVGRLLRYIVCHEVGHTLGLEHNFKASTAYTIAQLRDPKFVEQFGTTASIMSYSRFDYVAQPGDGLTSAWPVIGPYDRFAIEYGYKPIPGAARPDDEKPALDIMLARQVKEPSLRFGNYQYSGIDPTTQSENISNDPLEAGRLGMLNLNRIAKQYLLMAGSKYGEDYQRLAELHNELISQRFTELFHIVPLVGGVVETDYHAGRGGAVFAPVSPATQRAAVHFLVENGFYTPAAMFDPRILSLIQPSGNVDSATGLQTAILSTLLGESRVRRIQDNEALNPNAYSIDALVSDLTNGAWSELDSARPKIDVYRRSLQRSYLRTVDGRINGSGASRTDLKPLLRVELRKLAKKLDHAVAKAADQATAVHLADCRQDIERILNDKYSQPGGMAMGGFSPFGADAGAGCWESHAALREALKEAGFATKP